MSDWWTEFKFVTSAEAQALDCNLCGQCCSSVVAGTPLWHWGPMPPGRFRGLLTLVDERLRVKKDQTPGPVMNPYHCTALTAREDGTNICSIYTSPRKPGACGDFPLSDLRGAGRPPLPFVLRTWLLEKCTWHNMIVVPNSSEILTFRHPTKFTLPKRLTKRQLEVTRAACDKACPWDDDD